MAKFKKGDRVRALYSDQIVKSGSTGTVVSNYEVCPRVKWDRDDMLFFNKKSSNPYTHFPTNLEHVAKFRKGDRVKNLVETGLIKKGATGTVTENLSAVPYVRWDSKDMLYVRNRKILAQDQNDLELIDDKTEAP
jgi:hypothetical protein